jgi:hypothetical protein
VLKMDSNAELGFEVDDELAMWNCLLDDSQKCLDARGKLSMYLSMVDVS